MQTQLADFVRGTTAGMEAEAILRKCVHCGFCTATCPTYQLLGDELDSPRGRIYLIKGVLEGAPVTGQTQQHLDRCLTCRACETTCPSGVEYGRLVDIGRALVEQRVPRGLFDRLRRAVLATVLPNQPLFSALLSVARVLRGVLPQALQQKISPAVTNAGVWPAPRHARRMLVLDGCVQPVLAPQINAAAARVLDRIGISLIAAPNAGCCGGVRFHLNAQEDGRDQMRALIDAWWPLIEQGAEAIVMTASGCGVTVREYGHLLADDPRYAEKAQRVSAMTRDLAEVLADQSAAIARKLSATPHERIAFHAPCTLQHGQRIRGVVEALLIQAGCEVLPVRDSHLCCGSAGTYALLQPALATQLRDHKLSALQAQQPAYIATANIGCLGHLQSGTQTPVKHWIELLDVRMIDQHQ
jgi:glycolate oxidase iron-sulfur subunit